MTYTHVEMGKCFWKQFQRLGQRRPRLARDWDKATWTWSEVHQVSLKPSNCMFIYVAFTSMNYLSDIV